MTSHLNELPDEWRISLRPTDDQKSCIDALLNLRRTDAGVYRSSRDYNLPGIEATYYGPLGRVLIEDSSLPFAMAVDTVGLIVMHRPLPEDNLFFGRVEALSPFHCIPHIAYMAASESKLGELINKKSFSYENGDRRRLNMGDERGLANLVGETSGDRYGTPLLVYAKNFAPGLAYQE